jgi:hypothetical protein
MAKKRKNIKEVAFQNDIRAVESDLPLPYVYYPGFYGAFFSFSENKNSEIYFCSCSKLAIDNYIYLSAGKTNKLDSKIPEYFTFSDKKFPKKISNKIFGKDNSYGQYGIEKLNFKDDICHECNKQTPTYSYCHPMYGGVFEQNYGWYINKQSLEYGVMPVSYRILEDVCPDEIFSTLDMGKNEFLSNYNTLNDTDLIMAQAQDSEFQKATRKIRKVIENEVRTKFGFKKVGEAWANETLLYQLVCEIFPDKRILRHYRPEILDFLELDVYIPDLNIGLEYQGIQHFKPIDHWGGKKSLERLKKRDDKKKKLCVKHNIKLGYFYYYEELSRKLVEKKIDELIKP